jgi:hypothetical protein
MTVKACDAMQKHLQEVVQLHADALEGLACESASKVEKQMKLLLRNRVGSHKSAAASNQKILMEEIDPHFASWRHCWESPSRNRESHTMKGDFSIPDPELLSVDGDEDGL